MSQENAIIEVKLYVDALKSLMSEYQQAWDDPLGASASPVLCLYDVCLLAGLGDSEMVYIFGKRMLTRITKLVDTPLDVEVIQLNLPLETAGATD